MFVGPDPREASVATFQIRSFVKKRGGGGDYEICC